MKENNKKEIMSDKQWMKSMMETARKEPSDNLSYRIMRQIESEQALTRVNPKVDKQSVVLPQLNLWVFGLMYLVLFIVAGYFYIQGGKDALFTHTFLWTCIMIGSIFSFYFLITTFDDIRRGKTKNKPSHPS